MSDTFPSNYWLTARWHAITELNPTELHATIKLGIDAHAKWFYVARQVDGATPQPVQKLTFDGLLCFVSKQQWLARQVFTCYKAGALGYCLHSQTKYPSRVCPSIKKMGAIGSSVRQLLRKWQGAILGRLDAAVISRVSDPCTYAACVEIRAPTDFQTPRWGLPSERFARCGPLSHRT
jgi:hypothetical protein